MKVAVIGSGISGLYCAYKLTNLGHHVDIYEKNKEIGGRVKVIKFDGIDVVAGAGIGRKRKDKLLYKLCKELNVTTTEYKTKFSYTFKPYDILAIVEELKEFIPFYDRSKYTFSQFAKNVLGVKAYNHFTKSVNGTDFEDADIIDTIYDYGFDDCVGGYKAFSIKWREMLDAFLKIFEKNIHLNTEINEIIFDKDKFKIKNKIYDKIFLAIPPKNIKKILKTRTSDIYDSIRCQSFVRLYVKLNEPLKDYSGFIVTEKPFQKIIEMNREKCIYMISYSDNKIADNWVTIKNKDEVVEKNIKKIFVQDVKVEKCKFIYWKCGTHYFTPLDKKYKNRKQFLKIAQNPVENIYCVGEAFSRNQGWCEGALESVEKILSNF
jgi:protoporphyrinogen oxidase